MRSLVACLLVLATVSGPALAAGCKPNSFADLIPVQGKGQGAEGLLRSCLAGDPDGCERRIGLMLDTLDVVKLKAPVAQVVCGPEGLTAAEARDALLAWVARHYPDIAERWRDCGLVEGPYVSAAFAVMAALIEAYPCAERSG